MKPWLIGVLVVVLAGCGSAAASAPTGDEATVAVGRRDLDTELSRGGRVERAWQRTIAYVEPPREETAVTTPAAGAAQPATTTPDTSSPDTTTPAASSPDTSSPDTTTPATVTTTPTTTAAAAPTTTTATAAAAAAQTTTPAASTPAASTPAATGEDETPVLTSVAAPGTVAENGTVLFTVNGEPVVAAIGAVPAWRELSTQADDGADVRQLEEMLVALGYGDGVTVDESFTSATRAAVEAWETALGREDPDGAVTLGEIVFLPEAGEVLSTATTVGSGLSAGDAVLVLGSAAQVVNADVDLTQTGAYAVGTEVGIEFEGEEVAGGVVTTIGRDVDDDDDVDMTVTPSTPVALPNGSRVSVVVPSEHRSDVVAVPVAAVVAGADGEPAVRVVTGGEERLVGVGLGLLADGWIEITSGLAGGEQVVLPG